MSDCPQVKSGSPAARRWHMAVAWSKTGEMPVVRTACGSTYALHGAKERDTGEVDCVKCRRIWDRARAALGGTP